MKIIPLKIVNGLGARVAYWDEADVSASDDLRVVHKDTVLFLFKCYVNTDGSTDVLRDLSGISSMRLTIRGGPDKTDDLYVFHSTYNTAAGGFTPDLANGFAVMAVPIVDASGTPLATALAAATTTPDTYVEPWLEITMLEGGIPETVCRFQLKILEEIDDGAAGTPSPTSPTYYTAAEVDALLVDYLKSTAATELTIATGAITPTTQHHTVDTEGDAATDDLTTIHTLTGWLYVRLANAARVVTLKHGTSANQIACPGGTDVEMQANAEYLLHRSTASDPWRIVGGVGGMNRSVYDPTGVEGDAFDMANMVEAADAKVMTAAERTKLSGIAAGAEVNPDKMPEAEATTGTATTERLIDAATLKAAVIAHGGEASSVAATNVVFTETENLMLRTAAEGIDAYTKLLLHFDNDVVDAVGTHTVTDNNVAYDASVKVLGTHAIKLPSSGSVAAYMTIPDSADFTYGSADFTIDFHYRSSAIATVDDPLYEHGDLTTGLLIRAMGDGTIKVDCASGGVPVFADMVTGALSNDTWYHIALVRDGSTMRLFVDGTQVDSEAIAGSMPDAASVLTIGASSNRAADRYYDEYRISKGIARWTAAFTPPTVAYGEDIVATEISIPDATDGEITTGTETNKRLVSPAQLKLAAQTHAPGPPSVAAYRGPYQSGLATGAFRTVTIDAELSDPDNIAAVASNQIQIAAAGTYRMRVQMAGQVSSAAGDIEARIQDVTNATTLAYRSSYVSAGSDPTDLSMETAEFTLAGAANIEVQIWPSGNSEIGGSTYDPSSRGTYLATRVILEKVA